MTVLTSTVGLLSEEPEGSRDDDSSDSEVPGLLSGSVIPLRRRAFYTFLHSCRALYVKQEVTTI